MKRTHILAAGFVALASVGASSTAFAQGTFVQTNRVAVVYNLLDAVNYGNVRSAIGATLQELGVTADWVSADNLSQVPVSTLLNTYGAMIFPDGVAQRLPAGMGALLQSYVAGGGDVCIVADAGVKDRNGFYMVKAELADLAGVDYQRYFELGANAYGYNNVVFGSASLASAWHVQPGKTDSTNTVVGYYYGPLIYPTASAAVIPGSGVTVAASQDSNPILTQRVVGAGNVVFCNPPIGYLKSIGDGMLTFSVLHRFLYDVAKLPRLLPVEDGIGRMVMNWHVDSGIELTTLPWMISNNMFRTNIMQEFHVTSGPDLDTPGDGQGFDAQGKGRSLVQQLMNYGVIGSHGGWAHNWFAANVENGTLSESDIEYYVGLNGDALMSITGKPISGYAAPNGAHPPFEMARILTRLGIDAYYNVGDTGSPVTRSFFDGQMVSDYAWSFPLCTYLQFASLFELRDNGVTNTAVLNWLKGLVDFVAKDQTTRIWYSHPYDVKLSNYKSTITNWLNYITTKQNANAIKFDTMKNIAGHMRKVLSTVVRTQVNSTTKRYQVILDNPSTVKGLAVVVPKLALKSTFTAPNANEVQTTKLSSGDWMFVMKIDTAHYVIDVPAR